MANEVVQKIKETETLVEGKLREAQTEAKAIINGATNKGEEIYKEIITKAKAKRQEILDNGKAEGEKHCELIKEKEDKGSLNISENIINSVSDKIVERIVSKDGNI